MNIELEGISKSYNNRIIFNNLNYHFEDNKFYCIVGPSGCGKTTLLNILSGLLKSDSGFLKYNNKNISLLKKDDLRDFRLHNCGYIFQDFKLFENDTVFNNVNIVNDSISSLKNNLKKRKVYEVLDYVGIKKLSNKLVKNLSGGEKQRVAIARAIINKPKVIFADEPTGSLDSVNAEKIFSILNSLSFNRTIICVTHDEELANKYADVVLSFDKNTIKETKITIKDKEKRNFFVQNKIKRKAELSDKFVLKHALNSFKSHKFRGLLSISILIISLFSCGLSLSLKDSISSTLSSAFSSIMNENSIIMKRKNDDCGIYDYLGVSYNEVEKINNDYSEYIDYFGSRYISNIETFFKDRNKVYALGKRGNYLFDNLNARSFSEFNLLDFNNYKNLKNEDLEIDEIVLGLDYSSMRKLCKFYQVDLSFDSLNFYVKNTEVKFSLEVSNSEWTYDDEIVFRVVGVIQNDCCIVCHTDPFFNEKLFETLMKFPSSTNLKKIEYYPWVLKKIYYVHVKNNQKEFLNTISCDKKYQNFIFDNDSKEYSPTTVSSLIPSVTNKLFIYKVIKNDVPLYLIEQNKKINNNLKNFYISTNGGYINLGTEIFTGFSHQTYFSNSIENIDLIIDATSKIKSEDISSISIPNNTLVASSTNFSDSNVRISSLKEKLIYGKDPEEFNEVIISTAFANNLGVSIGSEIFISQIIDSEYNDGFFKHNFKTASLLVSGIFENEKNLISGDEYFSISLFRDVLKNSIFDLLPTAIVYEFENKIIDEDLVKLNSYYNDYVFINPISSVDLGINETLECLKYVLLGLSIVTLISSLFLITIICYIQIIEYDNDYYILSVLGYRNSELSKISTFGILLKSIIAFFISSILVVLSSFLVSKIISGSLNITSSICISIKPFLLMIAVMIFVVLFSSIICKVPLKKYS